MKPLFPTQALIIGGGKDAGKFVRIWSEMPFVYNEQKYTPMIAHLSENARPFIFAIDNREHDGDFDKGVEYLFQELQTAYIANHQEMGVL